MKNVYTLKVTANKSARTFTIREYQNGKLMFTWRTYPMPRQKFNDAQYMTENDWRWFMHSCDGEYYRVK